MRQTHFSLLMLSTLLMTPPLYAAQWVDSLLEDLGSSETVDESKPIDWGVLPGPFYNPEMGVGIGAAAIGLYRVDKQEGTRNTPHCRLLVLPVQPVPLAWVSRTTPFCSKMLGGCFSKAR